MKWSQHIAVLARLTGHTEFLLKRQDDDQYLRVRHWPRFLGSYLLQDDRQDDAQRIRDADELDAHLAACGPLELVSTSKC